MSEFMLMLLVMTTIISLVSIVLASALYIRYAIVKWPVTKGEVIESYIEKKYDKPSKITIFIPHVKYIYDLGTKQYLSSKIEMFLDTTSFVERNWAKSYTEKYKVGEEVSVHYHPLFKKISVLQISKDSKNFHIIAVSIVLAIELFLISLYFQ